ncbi:MAG: phosphoribosylanthranilate isomerase [Alloprevotella sp.]
MNHLLPSSRPLIKVCGLREAGNIRAVEAAGADWFGFIFYPPSPRYVSQVPAYLPQRGLRVGVFVHPQPAEVLYQTERFGLTAVQLHGQVTASCCRVLHQHGLLVVRALPVTPQLALEAAALPEADAFVFDTPTPAYGGSGQSYDWQLLQGYTGSRPFLLSGGLSLSSVPALHRFSHPACMGYDLNSGFETAPGLKDAEAVRRFVLAVRGRDAAHHS